MEPSSPSKRSSGSLPTDIVTAANRRLSIAAFVAGTIWLFYLVLFLTVWADRASRPNQIISSISIVVSYALAFSVRRCTTGVARFTGQAYEVLVCLALAMAEVYAIRGNWHMTPLIGWAAIVIVFFPTLLPQSPRATLATSLAAAAMAPLGYGVAHLLGADVSSDPSVLASMWIPHFVAALIAYVPAAVMHGLGADLKRARRLGSYELVERIGRGGMGEVWRARHRLLVRPAAIKLIRPDSKNLDALKQRFEREAQTTATLESPHTVELYDFGISDDGAFYYVMELLRGIDLETLVERFGPQPAERVIHILSQACDSLEDAHRAGLVHRDIKPANIYVASKGVRLDHVKVLDFGLVKAREHPTDIGATAEGTIIGTPAYMAPEMTTGDSEVDGRADLYALGCVGYWLLTGKLVFPGASPMQVAIAHATKDPEPPSNRTELPVPAALEHVIMACLAKRPSDRPSSAAELADRLSAIDVASPWTDDRAAAWWSAHLAEVTAGRHSMVSLGTAPTAFLNPAQSSK